MIKKPQDFSYLFLDMNSFFASVEKQVQPNIKNTPVGVTPHVGNTGCIIAACYLAKNHGVNTGCLVGEAKKLCPNIKIIKARPALYVIYHKEIKKVLKTFSPFLVPLSIDEFVISLDRTEQNLKTAKKLGREIKKSLKLEVGDFLNCSVGVGPNHFLAKMAAESQKPDGLTILTLANLEKFYKNLKLTKIPGIAKNMERKLKKIGIKNSLDFYRADIGYLKRHLGVVGRSWYFKLRGYQLETSSKNRSIGHSSVLAPNDRNKEKATQIIKKLIHKVGYRLRRDGYWAEGVRILIDYLGDGKFSRSKKVPPFNTNQDLNLEVKNILKNCQWPRPPLKVSLSVFNLIQTNNHQLSLLEDKEKYQKIAQTIDKINNRFGQQTISSASAYSAKDKSPNRIAFGQPNYEID
jgi:DNA polymerase-4